MFIEKVIYSLTEATTTSQLKITCLNQYKGSCTGKTEIYMLCDKVQKGAVFCYLHTKYTAAHSLASLWKQSVLLGEPFNSSLFYHNTSVALCIGADSQTT